MKKRISNHLIILSTLITLYFIITKKILIQETILNAISIWYKFILPSLFPTFIISDILINYNIINYIPYFLKKIFKYLFNISNSNIVIFFLSLISGFPSNARNARTMYEKKEITLEEANHILIFSHFANPVFIMSGVSLQLNNSSAIIILLNQYISNIILGIISKKYAPIYKENKNIEKNKDTFSNIFLSSINRSVDSILTICGILTISLVVSTIIVDALNLNTYNSILIKGLFEFTIGINSISITNLPNIYKIILSSIFISFGGLSVHMQVKSQIKDTPINYKYFLLGRIYQVVLSIPISYILCKIFNI